MCELFGCTHSELLDKLDAEEFALWAEYYKKRPWGCESADIRAAIISTVVNRSMGGKGQLKDFLPGWGQEAEEFKLVSFGAAMSLMGKFYGGTNKG